MAIARWRHVDGQDSVLPKMRLPGGRVFPSAHRAGRVASCASTIYLVHARQQPADRLS